MLKSDSRNRTCGSVRLEVKNVVQVGGLVRLECFLGDNLRILY